MTKEKAEPIASKAQKLLDKYSVYNNHNVTNATVAMVLNEFEDRQEIIVASMYIMFSMKRALSNPFAAMMEMILTDEDDK